MTRRTKWILIALIIGLIALLFKMKATLPATLISGVMGLAVVLQRILYVMNLHRSFKAFKQQKQRPGGSDVMTPDRAREILGVEKGASKREINAAYKKLMQINHPDKGGSDAIASMLNEARHVLIDELK